MFIHSVFNKKQAFTYYSVEEIIHMIQNNNIEIRETSASHVSKIRKYIIDNFMNESIYFPPLVACIDTSESLSSDKPTRLTIIDGSARLKALTDFDQSILKLISSDDEKKQRKGFFLKYRLKEMNIGVQIFEGLGESEINQLYIDLNSKGKKVSLSKRISNDSRDAINVATNQLMLSHEGLVQAGIEVERAAIIRPHNKKFLSLAQLRSIVVLYLTGKTSASNLAIETYGQREFDETYELLCNWFDELFEIHPAATIGNYHKTMLASFPIISAIAYYANRDLEEVPLSKRAPIIRARMQSLRKIDWQRDQEIWLQFEGSFKGKEQYYYINQNKKTVATIVEWLIFEGGE